MYKLVAPVVCVFTKEFIINQSSEMTDRYLFFVCFGLLSNNENKILFQKYEFTKLMSEKL